MKQRRLNELAQRSLAFLHICINELNILDVTFSEEGSISCWVFVSCLEILGTISNQNLAILSATNANSSMTNNKLEEDSEVNSSQVEINDGTKRKGKTPQHHANQLDFSVHTASLWDYAREKVLQIFCE